jgi:hypothetical protein
MTADLKAAHEKEVTDLYAEIGRLTTQLAWLKIMWPRPWVETRGLRWSIAITSTCR